MYQIFKDWPIYFGGQYASALAGLSTRILATCACVTPLTLVILGTAVVRMWLNPWPPNSSSLCLVWMSCATRILSSAPSSHSCLGRREGSEE